MVFLKTTPFIKQNNAVFTFFLSFLLCLFVCLFVCFFLSFFPSFYLQHVLHCLAGYCFSPILPAAVVSGLHLLKSVEGLLG